MAAGFLKIVVVAAAREWPDSDMDFYPRYVYVHLYSLDIHDAGTETFSGSYLRSLWT